MHRITPFLWFNDNAEEAMRFYLSVFKNSKQLNIAKYDGVESGPASKVSMFHFELEGQQLYALNGGPMFSFTPAISMFVSCENQQEVDYYWEKLSAGGEKSQCGWLKDKYGLSWQVVPTILGKLMGDKNPVKSKAVMSAMLLMRMLDVGALQKAYDQA
jgi:predicted 3-demethylubiquinone-9 3-methyltransferase (glyoxalase superfamily)